jgi:hypothetical protein
MVTSSVTSPADISAAGRRRLASSASLSGFERGGQAAELRELEADALAPHQWSGYAAGMVWVGCGWARFPGCARGSQRAG